MGNITRGTTPHVIVKMTDTPSGEIVAVYLTIKQDEQVISEKTIADCVIDGDRLYFWLTQEDTLAATQNLVKLQARIRLADGTRLASPIYKVSIGQILKEGAI